MARRRLLFVNNQGLGSVGGGVTILRHLVSDLAVDHDVIVASQAADGDAPPTVRQIRLADYGPSPNWRVAALSRAAQMCKAAPHDEIAAADAVVALDCHFGPALRRTVPRRLVYLSLSCLPRQEWFNSHGGAAAWAFAQYAWLERRIVQAADTVVVASEMQAREIRRFELLRRLRVEVIAPVYSAGPTYERKADSVGSLRLLAAGRLVPGKGFGALIEMMAHLRDVDCKLVIAGEGPDAQMLVARVGELGLSDRIEFAGRAASMDTLLSTADLFLHPSCYESFGIAVFEAQRMGVPPLCNAKAVAGFREFLIHGVNGLMVDFHEPMQAAEAIRTLAAKPVLRRALGDAAARSAASMAMQNPVGRFRALLGGILARGSSP